MLADTSFMACPNSAVDRPRPEMAEPNAFMTMPSSRTVVPAMSRQAIVMGVMRMSPPLWPGNTSCRARRAR